MNTTEFLAFRDVVIRERDRVKARKYHNAWAARLDANDRAFAILCRACQLNPYDSDGEIAQTLYGAGVPIEKVKIFEDKNMAGLTVDLVNIGFGYLYSIHINLPDGGLGYTPCIFDQLFATRESAITAGANEIIKNIEQHPHLCKIVESFIKSIWAPQETQLDLFGGAN